MDESLKQEVVSELIAVLGKEKVYFEKADLIPYSKDTFALRFSEEDQHLPDIITIPTSTEEVSEIVKIAASHSVPIIPKGGGTSRTGMIIPIRGGIVIDTVRLNKLLKLDRLDKLVKVQAGINLQELEMLLNSQGLTLGHEQGSQKIATIGGAISTASYSRKNQKYGNVWERIANLEVVLGDGRIVKTGPDVPYSSSGINLANLFVGAEGTLGVVTEATIRIEVQPDVTYPLLILFADYAAAEKAADEIVESGASFVGGSIWEDERGFESIGFPKQKGAMIIAFEGCEEEAKTSAKIVKEIVQQYGASIAPDKISQENWDEFLMHWCGMRAEIGSEDVIVAYVPRTKKDEYFEKLLEDILPRHGLTTLAGERKSLDFGRHMIFATRFSILRSDKGWEDYIAAIDETAKLIDSLGGTIAACHGVGLLHKEHAAREIGKNYLDLFRELKKSMDPKGILNPGKKFET